MKKISDELKIELTKATKERDKSSIREVSYWQGKVDALEQMVMTATICELENERNGSIVS